MPKPLTIIIGSAEEAAQREPWNGTFDATDKLIYRAIAALADTIRSNRHMLGNPAFGSPDTAPDTATVECTRCRRSWLLTATVEEGKSVVVVQPQGDIFDIRCAG